MSSKSSMRSQAEAESPQVFISSEAAGVSKEVTEQILRDLVAKFGDADVDGQVQTFRFLPSTKVDVDNGFQLLADTMVRLGDKPKLFDTVVTVNTGGRQSLRSLDLPMFKRGVRF